MLRDKVPYVFKIALLFLYITSGVRAVTSDQYPEQIHISYGSSHDSMVVMWSSRDQLEWEVHYGTIPTIMQMSTNSTMAVLPEADFKAAKFVYRTELHGLMPATVYFYRIVSSNDQMPMVKSQTFNFKTLPDKNNFDTVSRFVVYGDMGARMSEPTLAAIQALIKTKDVQAIFHIGDFAYDLNSDGGKVGDTFMNEIQSLAAGIPYMTAPGNHEIHENFEPYRVRFSTPDTPWPIPLNKMWYSFNVGLVHFISYSTEVYFTDDEKYVCDQFHWLMQDLIAANHNRDKRPWIIAMGHRPMYCSNNDMDDCTDAFLRRWVKKGLESLFNAQGVDMIIQAHEHSYERLYPLFDGEVERFNYLNPRAPVHVISGAAGSQEGTDGWTDSPNYWSAFRSSRKNFQSFGVLEIHNGTHLFFSQHDTRDNETADKFWMVQEQHGPFIEGVDCLGSFAHESCFCRLPLFRFRLTIGLMAAVAGLMLIAAIVLFIMFLKKRNGSHSEHNVCKMLCKSRKTTPVKVGTDCDTELLLDDQDT